MQKATCVNCASGFSCCCKPPEMWYSMLAAKPKRNVSVESERPGYWALPGLVAWFASPHQRVNEPFPFARCI